MCRHTDFCNGSDCYACDPLWCAKDLVKTAEEQATQENAKSSEIEANEHWQKVAPTLTCSLCEKTTKTWKPPIDTKQDKTYRWYGRQYKKKSIVLCPTCGTGLWYSHGPKKWEILAPKHVWQHSSAKSSWEREKYKLIARALEEKREEKNFSDVTDEQLNKILEEKGYEAIIFLTKPPPRKRGRVSEPTKVSGATQTIALTWKEDMDLIEYNKRTATRTVRLTSY